MNLMKSVTYYFLVLAFIALFGGYFYLISISPKPTVCFLAKFKNPCDFTCILKTTDIEKGRLINTALDMYPDEKIIRILFNGDIVVLERLDSDKYRITDKLGSYTMKVYKVM